MESVVQIAQRWIVAALRHRKFFSLEQANQAIAELLERLNHRPFRKREGSRASVFAELDRLALKPLPSEPFELSQWLRARVNIFCGLADSVALTIPNSVHDAFSPATAPHN